MKIKQMHGEIVDGFLIVDSYIGETKKGFPTPKVLLKCQKCGSEFERSASVDFAHICYVNPAIARSILKHKRSCKMNDTEKAARLEELRKLNNDSRVQALLVDMVELECQLDDLRQLPKYRVNPNNSAEVKISPAFYAYQKSLSAYKEIVKVLIKSTQGDDEEISPLRAYLKTKGGGV